MKLIALYYITNDESQNSEKSKEMKTQSFHNVINSLESMSRLMQSACKFKMYGTRLPRGLLKLFESVFAG